MRKYKQLLIGIIIGAIFFNVIPSFATTVKQYIAYESPYSMYVNGKEIKLDLPILNYNGSTYIPLRAASDILGVPLNFDGKIIKVGTQNNNIKNSNANTNNNKENIITLKLGDTYDLNGIKITLNNDIKYNQTHPRFGGKVFTISGTIENTTNQLQKITGAVYFQANIKDEKQKALFEERNYSIQYNNDDNYYFYPKEKKNFLLVGFQSILDNNNAQLTGVILQILGVKINWIIN